MIPELRYNADGLIPAIVQDTESKDILMMGWMNEESLRLTIENGTTWFWSRSRGELWNKGATSGNFQHVTEIQYDCDADALVVKVHPDGPACHTGETTCFYRTLPGGFGGVAAPPSTEPRAPEAANPPKSR